jgi:flagellar motor protein MotB
MTRPEGPDLESGVLVYPRMPLPKQRERGDESKPPPRRSRVSKLFVGLLVGAMVGGAAVGAILRPMVVPDPRIRAAEQHAEEAGSAAAAAKTRADNLEKELESVTAKKKEIEKRLEVATKAETKLADTAAEAGKKAKELEAAQRKLAAAIRGIGMVAVDGKALRISINTALLFVKDDVLSDRGKQIVERVGSALKEMSDQDASIEGHTDDTPLPVPKPPVPAAPPPPKKGVKPPPPPPAPAPPPVRFATNWELSAGRAVAIVRHLQEASKVDPARLSAVGYGQYRPITRRDKALNRRIEIVLSARPGRK